MIVPDFHQQKAEAVKIMRCSDHIYMREMFSMDFNLSSVFFFTRSVPQEYELERG